MLLKIYHAVAKTVLGPLLVDNTWLTMLMLDASFSFAILTSADATLSQWGGNLGFYTSHS